MKHGTVDGSSVFSACAIGAIAGSDSLRSSRTRPRSSSACRGSRRRFLSCAASESDRRASVRRVRGRRGIPGGFRGRSAELRCKHRAGAASVYSMVADPPGAHPESGDLDRRPARTPPDAARGAPSGKPVKSCSREPGEVQPDPQHPDGRRRDGAATARWTVCARLDDNLVAPISRRSARATPRAEAGAAAAGQRGQAGADAPDGGREAAATLEKRLSESFRQVSERLELVHKGLGEMQTLRRRGRRPEAGADQREDARRAAARRSSPRCSSR